jgi:hypothetical protein
MVVLISAAAQVMRYAPLSGRLLALRNEDGGLRGALTRKLLRSHV